MLQCRESATQVADEVSGDQDVLGEAPPAGPHHPGGLAGKAVQGPGGPSHGLCWDPLTCLQETAPTIGLNSLQVNPKSRLLCCVELKLQFILLYSIQLTSIAVSAQTFFWRIK